MNKFSIILTAAALTLGAGLAGCNSSGSKNAASGTYNAVTGNLSSTLDVNLDRSYNAAKAAVSDMGFKVRKDQKDVTQALLQVRDAADHNIDVTLKPLTDRTTTVTINQNPVTGSESTARL